MKYFKLIKKYPKFIYKDFFWKLKTKNLKTSFLYQIPPEFEFSSKITIKNLKKKKFKKETLDNLVFHLGLIEMLNYWKLTCSPILEIEAGNLKKDQINFFKKLIKKGMAQFFFENKIDFRKKKFFKIIPNKNKKILNSSSVKLNEKKFLVPLGGGKDSILVFELLKKIKINPSFFILNPKPPQKRIVKIAKPKETIFVKREIDKKLFLLNRLGFLNGHVPFSAFLAFLSVILAFIFDFGYIAFSWERSANEGNLKYKNFWINHQWSKSFEFEKNFFDYSRKYLLKNVYLFSFLRPLFEIQISKIFSNFPKYHFSFLSCNQPYKIDSKTKTWCKRCSKCLFIFTSLFPFLGKKIVKIFKDNLFEKRYFLPLMLEILGQKNFKPFECLGTKKENLVAFYLSLKRFKKDYPPKPLPFLLKYFNDKILPSFPNLEILSKRILQSFEKNHLLPPFIDKKIFLR